MASESKNSVFRGLLVEEYKKRANKGIDVVAQKRKNFQALILGAHNELKSKNFSDAKKAYWYIIELLQNDPYPDELNLTTDVYYSIKCCFCYSSLMDSHTDAKWDKMSSTLVKELSEKHTDKLFPKFLQVLLYFQKKNWAMTLQWCNVVEMHEGNIEQQFLTADTSEDVTNVVLPRKLQIVAEVEMYEKKAFFNYWTKLATQNLAKSKNNKFQFLVKEVGIIMRLLDMETSFVESLFSEQEMSVWCKNLPINYSMEEKGLAPRGNFVKEKTNDCIIRDKNEQGDKTSLEKFLVKLIESFTKIYNCSYINSVESCVLRKIEEIGDIVTQGEMKSMESGTKDVINTVTAQTQTDRLKSASRSVQTDSIKSKSVEVQVNIDMQSMNTLFDIKNKLLAIQEKKDESIMKLNKKLSEANEKLNKELIKRKAIEDEHNKKTTKLDAELKKFKDQFEENKKLYEEEKQKNISLQKQHFELFSDKYNTQKFLYKIFERKSSFMVNYLKDLSQCLTATSIPNKLIVQQNIDAWEDHQKIIQGELDQLNSFYTNVRLDLLNSQSFNNITWPEFPEFPRDEDNIIFASFKPAIKNIVEIEDDIQRSNTSATVQTPIQPYSPLPQNTQYAVRPQYPPTYFVGPRLVYPTIQQPIPISTTGTGLPLQCQMVNRSRVPYETAGYHMTPTLQTHVPIATQFNPNIQMNMAAENLRTLEVKEEKNVKMNSIPPTIWVGASNGGGSQSTASGLKESKKDRKYQEKEKIIYEYVVENCPNFTEEEVTLALLQVVNDNKGTLAKLSKDKIVQEVKMVLGMKKQSAWVTPKSPHIEWENDNAEPTCSICFEEFSLKETYALTCKHAYHKECIKKWLKTSSVCPICRIHSVIDEEFPPLH